MGAAHEGEETDDRSRIDDDAMAAAAATATATAEANDRDIEDAVSGSRGDAGSGSGGDAGSDLHVRLQTLADETTGITDVSIASFASDASDASAFRPLLQG